MADVKPKITPFISLSSSGDLGDSSMEKAIYSLLFKECDKENVGLVDVKELVGYIKRMQQQVRRHGEEEELFDSQDGSSFEDYDLQVLQSMLDTNCDHMNRIDQATYTDIISKWVKSVREQHPQVGASPPRQGHTSLELSQVSNSPYLSQEEQDHANYSYGSYEMDRTRSSLDSSKDHDLNDLVAKYQREIKLLNDRNKELLQQHEHSEETLRDYQSRARQLQLKLDEAHTSVKKFQHLETSNVELHREVSETMQENKDLAWAKDRLNRELDKLKDELSEARENLSAAEMDRIRATEEVKTMQQMVVKTKEEGRDTQHIHEAQLSESKSQLDLVTRDLEDAHNLNTELKSCITELESQLQEQQIQRQNHQPFSSTPHRHTQSLHDEIMGQEGLKNSDSPVSPVKYNQEYSTPVGEGGQEEEISRNIRREFEVSPAMESLAKLVDETYSSPQDSVVQHKHSLIMRDLGDLVFQSSPSNSHHQSTTITSMQDELSLNRVESKLKTMMRKKNQFKNENMNLKRENSDLKEQLKRLEEKLSQQQFSPTTPPYHQPHSPSVNRTHQSSSPSHLARGDQPNRSRSPVIFMKDDTEIDPVTGRHSPTFVSVTINPNERPSEHEGEGHVVIETSDKPIDSGFKSKSPRRVEFSDNKSVVHARSRSLSPNRLYSYPPSKLSESLPHSALTPVFTAQTQQSHTTVPPRSATPPPRSSLPGLGTFRDTMYSSGPRSMLSQSPPRDHSNGVKFADTILDSTHPPKDYVEDPSLDSNFKRGDFSPKHHSSLSKSLPPATGESHDDDDLIRDVREIFTSKTPNVSLSPRRSPDSKGATPLTPTQLYHDHDGIDHGGFNLSPQAHPRRRTSEGDAAQPSHLQYSELPPQPYPRRRGSDGDTAQPSHFQHSEPHPPQACPRHRNETTNGGYGPTGEPSHRTTPPLTPVIYSAPTVEGKRFSHVTTFNEPEVKEEGQDYRRGFLVGANGEPREYSSQPPGTPSPPPPTVASHSEPRGLPEESLQHAYNDLQPLVTALSEPRTRGAAEYGLPSRKVYSEPRIKQRGGFESQYNEQEEGPEHPTYQVYEPPAEIEHIVDTVYRPDLEVLGGPERGEELRQDYDDPAASQQKQPSTMLTDTTHCFYNVYQTLKITVLALFLSVLILALILLLVLSRDAMDSCGSYNPHSPVHLLYSSLEPYIHLHRDNPPI